MSGILGIFQSTDSPLVLPSSTQFKESSAYPEFAIVVAKTFKNWNQAQT
jgi:hypothetical protein